MILEIAIMSWPIWAALALALLVKIFPLRAPGIMPEKENKPTDVEFEVVQEEQLVHVDITV